MSTKPEAVYVAVKGGKLASNASSVQPQEVERLWTLSRGSEKAGEVRTFYGVGDVNTVVAVSTGAKEPSNDDAAREASRRAAAVATHALKAVEAKSFAIDPLYSAHAAAEGSTLASHVFTLKTTSDAKKKLEPVTITAAGKPERQLASEDGKDGRIPLDWSTGEIYAKAQNLARTLMDEPANRMTPRLFCERAQKELAGLDNVEVIVHDRKWAEEKKMGAFLSVNNGSRDVEPCKFLEAHYRGGEKDAKPVAFVGKGVTFDSGGVSLKPDESLSHWANTDVLTCKSARAGMKDMRADMGGAAVTLSTFKAIAQLKLPLNVVLCIPLTENMPSGSATKPGDCVVAMNGVTIEVDNTDAEGRLILADALCYASTFKPHTIVDVATLTGAMMIALGNAYTGVFTNSDSLWQEFETAGKAANDPFWRMPLSEAYMKQINKSSTDLCNTGGRLAGSCTAAIFLSWFVEGLWVDGKFQDDCPIRFIHSDIAGVMDTASGDGGYNLAGMTGRPTRSLIEFARSLATSTHSIKK